MDSLRSEIKSIVLLFIIMLQRKKNDPGGMVSIGIQNESGVQRSGSTTSKKKGKPRTLMCMDAAIQTGGWNSYT